MDNEIIDIIRSSIKEVITGNDISVKSSIDEDDDISVKESLKKDNDNKHIYNEFSLQHELGIKLRTKLKEKNKSNYLVQFERNITSFKNLPVEYQINENKIDKAKINKDFKKSEIDILIVNKAKPNEKFAIELKYHRKELGEVPDFIYNCVVDMWFVKRMVDKGVIKNGFCVVVTEDNDIYDAKRKITEDMRKNYIHFKDEDKTEVVKLVENKICIKKEENIKCLIRGDEEWNDKYNVVKKKPKTTNEYYYINTKEFYTEENSKGEKNTKLINWNLIKGEAKYYIKEFKKQTFYDVSVK